MWDDTGEEFGAPAGRRVKVHAGRGRAEAMPWIEPRPVDPASGAS
jgi:hypothetical protein